MKRFSVYGILLLLVFSCQRKETVVQDFYASDLFRDVQLAAVFPDSKTFVDCVPKRPLNEIQEEYAVQRNEPDFELKAFVLKHFDVPVSPTTNFQADTSRSVEEHIMALWPVLTRQPDDNKQGSSLITLPQSYIVPGGRFSEIYYWDSYFTILGLKASGRTDMVEAMANNFAYLIDSIGFIPNGNREYYLSRSQPPYFSLIVGVAVDGNDEKLLNYLPALQREYDFWMKDRDQLEKSGDAILRVVKLDDEVVLNRYWDNDPRPRPEAFKEDVHLQQQSGREAEDLYRNLRAACESGWDFSARWFEPGKGLESIRTTELIPVDLNCLLYYHEFMLQRAYALKGDVERADLYTNLAEKRKAAILKYMWNDEAGYFFDYHFPTQTQSIIPTLAGSFPLYFFVANQEQAIAVEQKLQTEFLGPGGLRTTLTESKQQWDAPNGWAPLQWIAYRGLKNYNLVPSADTVRSRWLAVNTRVYKATGKMMEKYNVSDITLYAGGGEYPNQDGFGWTNGVYLAMAKDQDWTFFGLRK